MGFLQALFVTSIIIGLTIVFGNTGSDLTRNIFLFIVGTTIGTLFSMIAYQIGRLFTAMSGDELFKYLYVLMGAWTGLAVAILIAGIVLPYNEKVSSEISFMSACFQKTGSKSSCEQLYNNMLDKNQTTDSNTTKQLKKYFRNSEDLY